MRQGPPAPVGAARGSPGLVKPADFGPGKPRGCSRGRAGAMVTVAGQRGTCGGWSFGHLRFFKATLSTRHLPDVAKQGGRFAPVAPNVAETTSDSFKIADTPRFREPCLAPGAWFPKTRQVFGQGWRGFRSPASAVRTGAPGHLHGARCRPGPRFPGLSCPAARSGRRPVSSTACPSWWAVLPGSGCRQSPDTTSDPGRGACGAVP
jgi:hypothetical protein